MWKTKKPRMGDSSPPVSTVSLVSVGALRSLSAVAPAGASAELAAACKASMAEGTRQGLVVNLLIYAWAGVHYLLAAITLAIATIPEEFPVVLAVFLPVLFIEDVEGQLFSEDGELNRYVNVYLNDEDVRVLDGLDTPVGDSDSVVILPAMAGGR